MGFKPYLFFHQTRNLNFKIVIRGGIAIRSLKNTENEMPCFVGAHLYGIGSRLGRNDNEA